MAGLVFSETDHGDVMLSIEVVDAASASLTRVPCGEFTEGSILRMCTWGDGQVVPTHTIIIINIIIVVLNGMRLYTDLRGLASGRDCRGRGRGRDCIHLAL